MKVQEPANLNDSQEVPKKPAEFNRRMTTVSIKGEAVKNLASVFERVTSWCFNEFYRKSLKLMNLWTFKIICLLHNGSQGRL